MDGGSNRGGSMGGAFPDQDWGDPDGEEGERFPGSFPWDPGPLSPGEIVRSRRKEEETNPDGSPLPAIHERSGDLIRPWMNGSAVAEPG
eukprot:scaffold1132_cov347-Pavlova_lutheri.AAC.12